MTTAAASSWDAVVGSVERFVRAPDYRSSVPQPGLLREVLACQEDEDRLVKFVLRQSIGTWMFMHKKEYREYARLSDVAAAELLTATQVLCSERREQLRRVVQVYKQAGMSLRALSWPAIPTARHMFDVAVLDLLTCQVADARLSIDLADKSMTMYVRYMNRFAAGTHTPDFLKPVGPGRDAFTATEYLNNGVQRVHLRILERRYWPLALAISSIRALSHESFLTEEQA